MDRQIAVLPADDLYDEERDELLALLSAAYEEDFATYLNLLPDPVHLIARVDGRMVSHLCWVTRWLQVGVGPLLRTAYVEAVATLPVCQGQGHASALLAVLPPLIGTFDIAALSPSDSAFYARFGWQDWRGPLLIRTDAGVVPPEEEESAMVLALPCSPALDLDAPLSVEWRPGEVW